MATDPLAEFLKCLEKLQPLASEVAALKNSTIEQETAALKKNLGKDQASATDCSPSDPNLVLLQWPAIPQKKRRLPSIEGVNSSR